MCSFRNFVLNTLALQKVGFLKNWSSVVDSYLFSRVISYLFIIAPCLLPGRFFGFSAVVAAQGKSFPTACAFFEVSRRNARSAEARDSTVPVNLPRLPRVFQISDPGFCGQDPGKRRVETGAELCWTRCRHHESLIHRRFWKIKMHKTVSKMPLRSTFLWYVSYGSTNWL